MSDEILRRLCKRGFSYGFVCPKLYQELEESGAFTDEVVRGLITILIDEDIPYPNIGLFDACGGYQGRYHSHRGVFECYEIVDRWLTLHNPRDLPRELRDQLAFYPHLTVEAYFREVENEGGPPYPRVSLHTIAALCRHLGQGREWMSVLLSARWLTLDIHGLHNHGCLRVGSVWFYWSQTVPDGFVRVDEAPYLYRLTDLYEFA